MGIATMNPSTLENAKSLETLEPKNEKMQTPTRLMTYSLIRDILSIAEATVYLNNSQFFY